MILVFGGTTEGRKTIETLEEGQGTYFYSTKTGEQDVTLHHGQRIDGALDGEAMHRFCREHDIRLLIDAAHPFAIRLHQTVTDIAASLQIPAIRYERIFPPRDEDILWIDDYEDIPHDIHTLLATTGVQSITRLKPLEAEGMKIYYRILPRESSVALARKQGATDEQLCYYQDGNSIDIDAEAILLKESGLSGGFPEKVEAARQRGMRIIALKRPQLPTADCQLSTVNGPYGLRRAVERLLPDFYPLHSGLTTGTCATAAAIAATLQLLKKESPQEVDVLLPNGETIPVPVGYGDGHAYCIKDSGDDPDVTKGIEVRASVQPSDTFEILGGEGVGTFTLPGFDYPPGEPAINKGPREMIRNNVMKVAVQPWSLVPQVSTNSSLFTLHSSLKITISVPGGEEMARRTFNPRLGIEGGISIIGVSGIIKPFSEEAFVESIRKCMEVAKASGTERVVINSGAKSERFVRALYPDLPRQAFVEYGNYIGETLKIAHDLGIRQVTLGVMLGKAVKLAEGQLDTHSKKGTMNLAFIRQMLEEANINLPISDGQLTLARELWDRIPAEHIESFCHVVLRHCLQHCQPLLPNGELTILLIADDGTIHSL